MKLRYRTRKILKNLIDKDIIAIPLVTGIIVLLVEYYLLNTSSVLPWLPSKTWTLLLAHVALVVAIYIRVKWDTIEEKAEDAVDDKAG